MSDTPWRDKERLYELYVEQELSTTDVGEELGCSQKTISKWLDRHDIEIRDVGRPPGATTDVLR
jgi:transposase-like protein